MPIQAPDVSKVNHEYSSATGGLTDSTRVQSATVTSHVLTTPVLAFGVQGIAGILNGFGTADVTIEEALKDTYFVTPSSFTGGGYALTVETGGVKWTIGGAVLTGATYTFPANDICTVSYDYVGTVASAVAGTGVSPDAGQGALEVLSGPNIEAIPGVAGTSATVTITADRDEIHYLGEATADPPGPQRPIRRPITVEITIEYLATTVEYLADFISNYEWNKSGITISIGGSNFYRMRPVDGSLSAGVGDNSTVSCGFTGWLGATAP